MTWINNLEHKINHTFGINPKITENLKLRFSKFKHRITFLLSKERDNNDSSRMLWGATQFDYAYASRIMQIVKKQAQAGNVKIRNQWLEFHLYFNDDILEFIKNFDNDMKDRIIEIQAMPNFVYEESKDIEKEYPIQIEVCKNLPFKKYNYKIFITSSFTLRQKIGRQNLNHLYNTIMLYEDIRPSPSFVRTQSRDMVWDEVYFYSKTLDLLPVIYLIEPRFIRSIISYKKLEDIKIEHVD